MGAHETTEFASWVAPHLVQMRRFALRLVGPADADDVVQDALTVAWRRWSTYDAAKGTPGPWLLAVVRDRARSYRRRHLRVLPSPENGATYDAPADVDLERAIARLSERQRLAVVLHYLLDLNIADTAVVMGCAPGTVKATLNQARGRLRDQLGDNHG